MLQSFRALTTVHSGRAKRLRCEIKLFKAFDPKTQPPPGPPYTTSALWDTGATNSLVTKDTANKMGLVPVGTCMMSHAGGSDPTNRYLVNIDLPNGVSVFGVTVLECQEIPGQIGAIIGMDIITQGDFSITNVSGKTVLSFRIPSVETIDYVSQAKRLTFAGVGRNAPCPCGKKGPNGQPVKFKHCCGKSV